MRNSSWTWSVWTPKSLYNVLFAGDSLSWTSLILKKRPYGFRIVQTEFWPQTVIVSQEVRKRDGAMMKIGDRFKDKTTGTCLWVNIGRNSQPKSLLVFCGVKSRSERLRKVGRKTAGFDGYDFCYERSDSKPLKSYHLKIHTFLFFNSIAGEGSGKLLSPRRGDLLTLSRVPQSTIQSS